ncbi:LysE family transporter [Streptomyces sp. NPDC059909]|uniref:LysE family transporter n=1 Tax=Streptomyces sp. NPDC059909 TaxID=3346998 RepID=UPI0036538A45
MSFVKRGGSFGPGSIFFVGHETVWLCISLFPQFIDPAGGRPDAAQTGLLGTLHMTACALVYLAVGVLARTVLKTRPSAARAVPRVSGAMMIVIGGFLLVERLAG